MLRRTGILLIVIGAIISIISLGAELIGISDDPGFQVGPRQLSGILLGLVVLTLGVVLLRRDRTG